MNALKHKSSSKLLAYILIFLLKHSFFKIKMARNISSLFLQFIRCYHYSQNFDYVRKVHPQQKVHFFDSFNTHYTLKFGMVCRFIGSGVSNSKTYLNWRSSGLQLQIDGKNYKKDKHTPAN